MANEKMTWTELRKAVAEMAGTSEQEATTFLNALVDAILVGLKADQQVKLKGIGTFALKAMAARKSVNIATGEEFTIEGYNKLTFSAEASLKESVEKRIETPQTAETVKEVTADPLKKLGEQAEEIVDILADLGQVVNTTENGKLKTENGEVEPAEEVIEKPVEETIEEPIEEIVEETIEESVEKVVEEGKPIAEETTQEPTCKPTGKCHKWVCWLIGAIILLGIIGTGVYFRATLQQWWQCMQDCQPTIEIVEEVSEVEEVLEVEELTLADQPREYVNFIGIERVGQDSRLAWIAYKYYAQKDLWVFIYEANRDIIKDPTYVRPGQHIRIPELDEKYRNLYNPELRQLVDSLAAEYLK
jgi:nucleoid DNA-binding protein